MACKSNGPNPGFDYGQGTGNCRIATITTIDSAGFSQPASKTLSYDEKNRLVQIELSPATNTQFVRFEYGDGYVIKKEVDVKGRTPGYYDSMRINSQGQLTEVYFVVGNPFSSSGNQILSNIDGKKALGVWGGYGVTYYRLITE